MNVHALVHARIVSALEALQREGALPAGLDLANVEVSPPREAAHGDLASNAALVLAKAAKMKPRDIAEKLAEKLRAQPDIETVEVAGRRLPQHALRAALLAGRGGGDPEGGRRLRPRRPRPRRARQRRVRLGQPDRAHARRPLPRRGVRRCAGQPARLRRLRRDARVLHQRRRRPGRCAGPLRLPALPRGAGRGHRRDPRRALSGRLPEAGRRRAGAGARPRAAELPRGALAAGRARGGHRRHAGRRSRRISPPSTSSTTCSSRSGR